MLGCILLYALMCCTLSLTGTPCDRFSCIYITHSSSLLDGMLGVVQTLAAIFFIHVQPSLSLSALFFYLYASFLFVPRSHCDA